jgi:coenzyme F420 hydrogenase subunit beta
MIGKKAFENVAAVVRQKLCCGCGACSLICSQKCIKIDETSCLNEVSIDETLCIKCQMCLCVCTGYELYQRLRNTEGDKGLPSDPGTIKSSFVACVKELDWRRRSASGGFVSGLALALLEVGEITGVSCIKQDPARPLESIAFAARSSDEVKSSRGSRYMPVSACLGINGLLAEGKQFMFVGKPCDVSAVAKLKKHLSILGNCNFITLSIFCHNTPYRRALTDLFKKYNLPMEGVKEIRFRGNGWPGNFVIGYENGKKFTLPYTEAWGKNLSKIEYVPVRCLLCDDPLGREADISVGDPWGKEFAGERNGYSLVVLRTKLAEQMMDKVNSFGNMEKHDVTTEDIFRYQQGVLNKVPSVAMWRNMYRLLLNYKNYKLIWHEMNIIPGIKNKLRYCNWLVILLKKRYLNY